MGCGNTFALLPPLPNQSPLYPWALHMPTSLPRGAPHGRPRGLAWMRGPLPRGCALCAFCAPRGPPTALPRGLSAASQPCGGPVRHVSARRSSRSPRQHLQVRNSLFRDFSKRNINKNQIKIRKGINLRNS